MAKITKILVVNEPSTRVDEFSGFSGTEFDVDEYFGNASTLRKASGAAGIGFGTSRDMEEAVGPPPSQGPKTVRPAPIPTASFVVAMRYRPGIMLESSRSYRLEGGSRALVPGRGRGRGENTRHW